MSRNDARSDSSEATLVQLTIRGFDPELERRLRALAQQEGTSLNQAALQLMRRGAGLTRHEAGVGAVGDSLDAFFGGWTDEEAQAFEAAVEIFEQIDPEMWS